MAERIIKVSVQSDALIFNIAGMEPLTFHPERASAANRARAELHGWKQRISDAAALDKGATAEQKRAAMEELVLFYEQGGEEWERARTGGGAKPFDVGLVVTALATVKTGGDVDKANRAIDAVAVKRNISRVDAAKLFAADEAIAVEMTRIRAASRPAKVDADELLADIG